MDREGDFAFTLRPKSEKYAHRLLCEVTVQDNVKIVTLRSTYKVENSTLYPLELTLVDASGQPVQAVEKIGMFVITLYSQRCTEEPTAPGHDYALPIDAVGQYRVRIQPDRELPVPSDRTSYRMDSPEGFGYRWSSAIRWEDVVAKRRFTIKCPHTDPNESAFRFQASVETDVSDVNSA